MTFRITLLSLLCTGISLFGGNESKVKNFDDVVEEKDQEGIASFIDVELDSVYDSIQLMDNAAETRANKRLEWAWSKLNRASNVLDEGNYQGIKTKIQDAEKRWKSANRMQKVKRTAMGFIGLAAIAGTYWYKNDVCNSAIVQDYVLPYARSAGHWIVSRLSHLCGRMLGKPSTKNTAHGTFDIIWC